VSSVPRYGQQIRHDPRRPRRTYSCPDPRSPVVTLLALVIGAAVAGMLASLWPARRAARLDVLRALAYE